MESGIALVEVAKIETTEGPKEDVAPKKDEFVPETEPAVCEKAEEAMRCLGERVWKEEPSEETSTCKYTLVF